MDRFDWFMVALAVVGLGVIGVSVHVGQRNHDAKRAACLEEMGRAHVSPKRADEVCP